MKKKKAVIKKYDLGSFVTKNQSGLQQAGAFGASLISSFEDPNKANVGGSTAYGALSGASAGLAFGPWGAAVGGVVGGVAGLIGGKNKEAAINRQKQQQLVANQNTYNTQYNNQLDTNNQDPYGNIYQFEFGGIIPGPDDPITLTNKKRPGSYIPDANTLMYMNQNYDPTLLGSDGKFNVQKRNGNLMGSTYLDNAQWGNDPNIVQDVTINKGPISDKAAGLDNHYDRASSNAHADIPMIKSSSGRNRYAQGGAIDQNAINIEKGELLIDPESGKILQDYSGINPLTGGLFEPHAKKGKDTKNNFTIATPGQFVITKKAAKSYKDAVDNNDSISKKTILMNIQNKKVAENGGLEKYADGGPINPQSYIPGYGTALDNLTMGDLHPDLVANQFSNSITRQAVTNQTIGLPNHYVADKSNFDLNGIVNGVANYLPAASNILNGLFGKAQVQPYGQKAINPFTNKILSNLPQNINTAPIVSELYNNAAVEGRNINSNTNSSAIARANRQQLLANTSRQLANIRMQGQQANNQVASQRAEIYNQLGSQDMQEQSNLRSYNLGIDDMNNRSRAVKQNILNTGIEQLQQTYQNGRTNSQKAMYDQMMAKLLPQIYPYTKYYSQLDPTNFNLR